MVETRTLKESTLLVATLPRLSAGVSVTLTALSRLLAVVAMAAESPEVVESSASFDDKVGISEADTSIAVFLYIAAVVVIAGEFTEVVSTGELGIGVIC